MLRKKGVVDKFVEFFGDGLANLPLADRATIGNMSPEFGSTCAIFPIDEETLRYLQALGPTRSEQIQLVEDYARAQGLWRTQRRRAGRSTPMCWSSTWQRRAQPRGSEPAAGPGAAARCQERPTRSITRAWPRSARARTRRPTAARRCTLDGQQSFELRDGAVLIAAITSCTNTSNPYVLMAAGLLARNAQRRGLTAKPWVKTSLAPGSRVVTRLSAARPICSMSSPAVGFNLVGYGCTTCICEGHPCCSPRAPASGLNSCRATGESRVVAPNRDGRLAISVQSEMMVQGERECVALVLQDGRTLTCTPDHRMLRADGRWIRADELKLGHDRVMMGLEAPLDEPSPDETGYELRAGELTFSFASSRERRASTGLRAVARPSAQRRLDQPGGPGQDERRASARPRRRPQRHRAAHGEAPSSQPLRRAQMEHRPSARADPGHHSARRGAGRTSHRPTRDAPAVRAGAALSGRAGARVSRRPLWCRRPRAGTAPAELERGQRDPQRAGVFAKRQARARRLSSSA